MNLLASYNLTEARKDKTTSPVEVWRIQRPADALRKNLNWSIDESIGIFPESKKVKDITEQEMLDRVDYFKKYDLVWGSYYTNPFIHSFTMIAQEKIKTKFVMDIDDNLFSIDKYNPVLIALEEKYLQYLRAIVIDSKYLTTTTETLANQLREYRGYRDPNTVVVIPNLISTEKYIPAQQTNKKKIVIGYAGGASHYADLHHTGMYDALAKIMHEHKDVYVEAVGMYIDKYLPKARYKFIYGEKEVEKWYKLYGKLKFDIAVAPLEDTAFTKCKSNIKWQEYSLMGIPTIASNVGPYKDTIKHGSDGWLCENTTEAWYNAFKLLITNQDLRNKIGDKAKERVINEFSIEKNWQKIQQGLETIIKL
jgi:processive 1,2-diacylglycerol beta-glucosyltransferase